jgi:hypothetical protein
MILVTCEISRGIWNSMSEVTPSCFVSPLIWAAQRSQTCDRQPAERACRITVRQSRRTLSQSFRLCGSTISLLGMKPEMGLNVSKPARQTLHQQERCLARDAAPDAPFAVLQGRPLALTAS